MIWKSVIGYEGFYEVSGSGDIRRVSTGRILKQKVEKNGYARVHLSLKGNAKSELVHRVVAKAFIPNPKFFETVNQRRKQAKQQS